MVPGLKFCIPVRILASALDDVADFPFHPGGFSVLSTMSLGVGESTVSKPLPFIYMRRKVQFPYRESDSRSIRTESHLLDTYPIGATHLFLFDITPPLPCCRGLSADNYKQYILIHYFDQK
ncbi:hypothetical protein BDZ91DRAFT_482060 [Kalaharituber pfeilii]|nr:hypothetical protein BDZ91DRAFT_482060 [Kalaharituber pfeilii]